LHDLLYQNHKYSKKATSAELTNLTQYRKQKGVRATTERIYFSEVGSALAGNP